MSHQQSVLDLKALVRSFHSLIAIETVEEERVQAILGEVASDLNLPLFEWSVASGFHRGSGPAIRNTHDALGALRHMGELRLDAIYLLKDLGPHLAKPETARELRELAERLTNSSSAIILTADPVELPRDLDALAD